MHGFISLSDATSYDKNNFMASLHERMLLNPRIEHATVSYDFDF